MRLFRNRSSENPSGVALPPGSQTRPDVPDPLGVATERIGWVRRSAERARADIGAEVARLARVRTKRDDELPVRERLAADLAGALAERTAALAAEADELARTLERAQGALARAGAPQESDHRSGVARGPAGRIELARGRRFRRPSDEQPIPEAARRLAAQMVVTGASPEEVSARLRRDYGVEDPDAVPGLTRI